MYFSMCDFQVHKNRDRSDENNINTIRDKQSKNYTWQY